MQERKREEREEREVGERDGSVIVMLPSLLLRSRAMFWGGLLGVKGGF